MISSRELRERVKPTVFWDVYALESVHSTNQWHDEDVLTHTIEVMEQVEQIWPRFAFVSEFDRRGKLLYLATALHDIGKKTTLVDLGDGTNACPQHEEVSYEMSKLLLPEFGLTYFEQEYALQIIRDHGKVHHAIKSDNYVDDVDQLHPKLELTVLGYADTMASILPRTNPEKYASRIARYEELLSVYRE